MINGELTLKLSKSYSRISRFRLNFSLGTDTKIAKWLRWQNNPSDIYVTNPPAVEKQNEFVFTSGLLFTSYKTDWS